MIIILIAGRFFGASPSNVFALLLILIWILGSLDKLLLRTDAIGNQRSLHSCHVVFAYLIRDGGQLKEDTVFGIWHLYAALFSIIHVSRPLCHSIAQVLLKRAKRWVLTRLPVA